MAEPYLGEIRMFAGNFAPVGWAFCNGQLMAMAENDALLNRIGTTYGGDGRTTLALPDLQGRTPIHMGTDQTGNDFSLGTNGGEQAHTLTMSEMAAHTHPAVGSEDNASLSTPVNNFWAKPGQNAYANTSNSTMAPQAVTNAGGSQPHDNLSPYLVPNFIIALQGIFPSRN